MAVELTHFNYIREDSAEEPRKEAGTYVTEVNGKGGQEAEKDKRGKGKPKEQDTEKSAPTWRWVILFAGIISTILQAMVIIANSKMYLMLVDRFSMHYTFLVSGSMSTYMGVRYIIGPAVPALIRKTSHKSASLVGGMLMPIGLITVGYINHIVFVYIGHALSGAGAGLVTISTFTILTSYFDKRRSFALGFANVGFGIGSFIVPFIVTHTYDVYGFSGTWLIIAGVVLNFCAAALTFRPYQGEITKRLEKTDEPEIVGNNQESELNNEHSANANGKMESNSGGTALGKEAIAYSPKFNRSLAFYFFLASLAFLSSCTSCVQVLILGLAEEHGIASSEHTMIFSAMAIVETVSLIPLGFMLDLPRVKPFWQYVYCCILMLYGLCIGLMAFFKEMSSFTTMAALQAVMKESLNCQITAIIVDVFGMEVMTTIYGISNGVMGVSYVGWPIAVGLMNDAGLNYAYGFLISGSALFVSSLLFLGQSIRDRKKQI